MYIIRVYRTKGLPNEVHTYQTLEAARRHFESFYDDESDQYSKVEFSQVNRGKERVMQILKWDAQPV